MLPVDAGRLDDACFLERLIAVESELGQCYGLDFRVTFELLGAESDAARPS